MSHEIKHAVADEDEIDLKELFERLYERKWTIFSVFVITLIFGIFTAYFTQPVYQTSSVLRIKEESKSAQTDMLQMAMGGMPGSQIDTEIGILKSYSLIKTALEQVPFGVRYFVRSGFKTQELYHNEAPIAVTDVSVKNDEFYGRRFILTPQNDTTFLLEVKPGLSEKLGLKEGVSYRGRHTYGELITTDAFALRITRNSGCEEQNCWFSLNDTRSLIEGIILPNLQATQAGKMSSLIQISYQDNVPQRAQAFANALAGAYIQQTIDFNTEEASKTLDFIRLQLDDIKKSLETSALNVEKFKQSHDTMDITAETKAAIEKLTVYDQQLAQIEIEENQAERLSALLKKGDFSALSIAPMQITDPLIGSLMQSLSEAERKKQSLLVEYTELHPDVVQQSVQIDKLKKEIASNINSLREGIAERKRSVSGVIARNEAFFEKLPATERQYVDLARSFQVNEKIYSYLLEKQSEASIAKASTVSSNRIVDPALLPLEPIKPKKSLIVAVAAILGMILGIFVAFVRNFLDDTIKGYDDIARETDIPVIGSIPFIKEGIDSRHLVMDNPRSVYAESFRAMRTNLQFMATYANHKTIMVTSTLAGEGKTTTASNLGAILAISGKKTVILNLDLRLPMLHEVFDLPNERGMSNYLSGHAGLDEVIQHTSLENLDIISSGAVPPNPSELIMSERLREGLSKLHERYDYVILDTPPVGLVTDALILANEADITLFVVRVNHAKRGFAARFDKTVRQHNVKNTGIIVSAVPPKKGSGGYGYGYGYGYGEYGGYGQEAEPKKSWIWRWLGR